MNEFPPPDTASPAVDIPQVHMSPPELELLRKYYAKATCYIEFGCGGSTFEALQFENIKSIYSIESDKAWVDKLKLYPIVADALQQKRIELIHVDIGPVKMWGTPAGPTHVAYWPDYYWGVWTRLPKNPDCLLIDGRFRVACTLMAALMCEPGRVHFLIHDFKGRPEYHILHKYFQEIDSADQLSVFLLREPASARNLLQDLHDYLFVPKDHISQRHDIYETINGVFKQLDQAKEHCATIESGHKERLKQLLDQQRQHCATMEAGHKEEVRAIDNQWRRKADRLKEQVEHEKLLRVRFKKSLSWRITAPLRAVGRFLGVKKK